MLHQADLSKKAPKRVLFCGAHQSFAILQIAFTRHCLVSKLPLFRSTKLIAA